MVIIEADLIKERDDLRAKLSKEYSPFLCGYEAALTNIINRMKD